VVSKYNAPSTRASPSLSTVGSEVLAPKNLSSKLSNKFSAAVFAVSAAVLAVSAAVWDAAAAVAELAAAVAFVAIELASRLTSKFPLLSKANNFPALVAAVCAISDDAISLDLEILIVCIS